MKLDHFAGAWWLALAALLSACGGGGSDAPPGVRTALPELVLDENPTGLRIDRRDRNYFVAGAGDTWIFDRVENGSTTTAALTRAVQSASASEFIITETEHGMVDSVRYRRTAEGIVSVDPLAGVAPGPARLLVGDLLEFPEPFFAVGGVRRVIRQGGWGEDLDGDGVGESFRIEMTQVLVGFETLGLPRGSAETAHFRTTIAFTLAPSSLKLDVQTVVATEESWWAPGVGLVRATRSAVDASGAVVEAFHTLAIASANVGGKDLFAPEIDGTLVKIDLTHSALVYDAGRKRYYATIPGSVGQGNSIATIDAVTGALAYSRAIGSEPSALGIAAGGSALYVGLDGSGEVVKLRLPDMVELDRVRLPVYPSAFGQTLAETIAPSPTDPNAVAVSTRYIGVSPRHAGVVLIRDGQVQPRRTQEHTGSNLIAFDGNGKFVYGFNNETTEFGLRRIEVFVDGLAEQAVVTASSGGFGTSSLDFSPFGLVLGDAVYHLPDIALKGRAPAPNGGCRARTMPKNQLVCLQEVSMARRLAVIDPTDFRILATPAFDLKASDSVLPQLVIGPPGQVALRFGAAYVGTPATGLWLFTSPDLE